MKRIILVGKGGSGKDYLRKELQNLGYKYCISHTTRPPRTEEVEGKDYHFISLDTAIRKFILEEKFYEWVVFNEWIYGTSLDEFYSSNLFIMTPSGIAKLKTEDRKESYIIYLDIDEKTRKERLSLRNDADILERRLAADKLDFDGFDDFDFSIKDPLFDTQLVISKFSHFLKLK